MLAAERAAMYEVDLDACRTHWEKLQTSPALFKKIQNLFRAESRQTESDPDFMIYSGGFFSEHDKELMHMLRATKPEDLGRLDLPFRDRRLSEMFFRYRARNYLDTLNSEELAGWEKFRAARLSDTHEQERYQQGWQEAQEQANDAQREVLTQLQQYVETLV